MNILNLRALLSISSENLPITLLSGMTGLSHAEADVCACGRYWADLLGLPEMVRFRCTTSGTVFHISPVVLFYGKGYARYAPTWRIAAGLNPSLKRREIPAAIRSHKKLRGGKTKTIPPNHVCPRLPGRHGMKITAPLWLACESKTDVLEGANTKEDQSGNDGKLQALSP